MDDFNVTVDLNLLEVAGLFAFSGLQPGSLVLAIMSHAPPEVIESLAHHALDRAVLKNTVDVIQALTPNVVVQNATEWKGLWNESEAHQMQWKLEATEPQTAWGSKIKTLIEYRRIQSNRMVRLDQV